VRFALASRKHTPPFQQGLYHPALQFPAGKRAVLPPATHNVGFQPPLGIGVENADIGDGAHPEMPADPVPESAPAPRSAAPSPLATDSASSRDQAQTQGQQRIQPGNARFGIAEWSQLGVRFMRLMIGADRAQ
jgi:hypothetical protein